ncbi:MAG TPA: DUF4365 domain-containing protein [Vicinamibacterales bacterium]|jgi:hypothetical protein
MSIIRLRDAFTARGWSVDELSKDYGEDLVVRIFDNGMATPYTFYVQAKSTDRLDRHRARSHQSVRYRLDASHVAHWRGFWDPVLFTIWDRSGDVTYWEVIQTAEKITVGGTIYVPMDNVLDAEGLDRIRYRTIRRHNRLRVQQIATMHLLQILSDEHGIRVDFEAEGVIAIETADSDMVALHLFGDAIRGLPEDLLTKESRYLEKVLRTGMQEFVANGTVDHPAVLRDQRRASELQDDPELDA